jgi:hypothetical protein
LIFTRIGLYGIFQVMIVSSVISSISSVIG